MVMSRMARVVAAGVPHHITQRGNRRADVFFDDEDRVAYRQAVLHSFTYHQLKVWAYCMMSNHVHFIVVPPDEKSMGYGLRDAHTSYALGFNRRHGLSGHLWQGRFFSCPLDDAHAWAAIRYVERNPLRAGMVEDPVDYKWCSASAHCGKGTDALLPGDFPPADTIPDWHAWLKTQPEDEIKRIRKCTTTGRPCGSKRFLDKLEETLGRSLHHQKPGPKQRPPDSQSGLLWS